MASARGDVPSSGRRRDTASAELRPVPPMTTVIYGQRRSGVRICWCAHGRASLRGVSLSRGATIAQLLALEDVRDAQLPTRWPCSTSQSAASPLVRGLVTGMVSVLWNKNEKPRYGAHDAGGLQSARKDRCCILQFSRRCILATCMTAGALAHGTKEPRRRGLRSGRQVARCA